MTNCQWCEREAELGHRCGECDCELNAKQCEEYGGLCYDCMWVIANY